MSDKRQSDNALGRPVAVSLSCHAALFAVMIGWGFLTPDAMPLGDPDGDKGTAVAVTLTGIPINVPRAEPNPVANPVTHQVPAPEEKPEPAPPEPDPEPEAVEVEEARKPRPQRQEQARADKKEQPDNQVPSTTGAQASDPIFSGQERESAGGIGVQGRNPFGTGFGGYATALQRRLSQEWSKSMGQIAGTSSKPVVVQFRILRNGAIDRIRVVESSGNRSLDYSAHRAVVNVNPFRPLPPAMRRPAILVEMWFRLK